jgi:hypothetical protein
MNTIPLIPCSLDTLFIRGKDYIKGDGPLARIAMIAGIHDDLSARGADDLMPYVAALFLLALEPYGSEHSYHYEPTELMPRIVRGLTERQEGQAETIVREWLNSCPKGYVLLPTLVAEAVSRVQAATWQHEINDFVS